MDEASTRFSTKRKAYVYQAPKRLKRRAKLQKTDSTDDIKELLNDDDIRNLLNDDSHITIDDDDGDIEYKDKADELVDSIFKKESKKAQASSGVEELINRMKSPVVVVGSSPEASDNDEDDGKEELIDILKNDEILVKRTTAKYSQKNFKPKVYTKKELLFKIKDYYEIIPKILKGELKSYFYGLGFKLMKESKHDTIQSWEFRNLPLNLLQCGYIGKKRSMIVKRKIFLKFNSILSNNKDKVVRYFGIDNFITYILLPELISYFIKDEFKLSDVDKAIDLMELTNDYGLYIMDKIDPLDQEYDSDKEDDEDMKNTKLELNIVQESNNDQEPDCKFVQDIIGLSDSDSEDDL